eukprot:351009-Chlamydomonas_euryale.AAC.2
MLQSPPASALWSSVTRSSADCLQTRRSSASSQIQRAGQSDKEQSRHGCACVRNKASDPDFSHIVTTTACLHPWALQRYHMHSACLNGAGSPLPPAVWCQGWSTHDLNKRPASLEALPKPTLGLGLKEFQHVVPLALPQFVVQCLRPPSTCTRHGARSERKRASPLGVRAGAGETAAGLTCACGSNGKGTVTSAASEQTVERDSNGHKLHPGTLQSIR